MLNCTDLACILHHHHYYAQLHHLKHGTHHVEGDGESSGSIHSFIHVTQQSQFPNPHTDTYKKYIKHKIQSILI